MTAPTILSMVRDNNGYNTFGLEFPSLIYGTTLLQNDEQSFTLPPTGDSTYTHWLAIFEPQPGITLYVSCNDTAAPPGGSFAAVTSETNPGPRKFSAGDVLSFLSPNDSNYLTVALYATV